MAKKRTESTECDGESIAAFEQSLAQLTKCVQQLESGDLTLGQSLQAYEDGVRQLKICFQALNEAERKIEILTGFQTNGEPTLQPFDDSATLGDEQVGKRGREGSKGGKAAARPSGEQIDAARELF